jgi:(heptosyl)LPS beta-1,4-glucosyltransferase
MRLGGYVIHGSAAETLPRCLDSLRAVCDEVVAVHSGSTDGSADLARAAGARVIDYPWEGYGAARAVGALALAHCDYQLFLDSDEWFEAAAVDRLRAWKRSGPAAPRYVLLRNDWAELPTGRFRFRTEHHVRIARSDAATWDRSMVVHEALPRAGAVETDIRFEHRFVTDLAALGAKEDRYALLWALAAHRDGRRAKAPLPSKVAHALRFALAKGALFRGGAAGWRLAWTVASYHARKHERLAEVAAGGHAEARRALAEGRYAELYSLLPR